MNAIEGWTQTLGAGPLLLIAAAAIAVLLVLIIRFKMHALLALITVSLATAFATGIPADKVVGVLVGGFGTTLGTVALLVGLGVMLGRIVETSGGAKVLADYLIGVFGEKRAPFALGLASLIFGFPIFFDAGLVVMLPVVFAVAHRLGGGVLRFGLPAVGAFSVMHVFLPPHPGPVSASAILGANVGLVVIVGLIAALPTWYLTCYLYGLWTGRKLVLPVPEILGHASADAEAHPPRFRTVVSILLLPLVLIFLNTGLNTLATSHLLPDSVKEQQWFQIIRALGDTPVALLISVFVAALVLGMRRGLHGARLEGLLESSLGPVCSVILITGAGGMFGAVLRTSGIGKALADVLGDAGIPLILAGFLISSILRIAQGSATVALTTTAGLIAPAVAEVGLDGLQLAALVVAVAAGSVVVSHVNDAGFWMVGRFMGMDVKTTLATWTVMETLIGVMGFGIAAVVFAAAGAAG
ncbi:GntP family permease [Arthrobacter cupressi]|uniref:Gluconate:H+ symporter, GntP family n=1 Tax=Arthrobacter cupressi TaxID=1045773 RepID=A0A1G8W151_9MICC|nr:GntP family permease [Arthrobacter cupressi]NYD78550.1 GntP family gluconate:H+ symporter [Arthrobacter cupressi]SDJ71827.1 gluconate:H+ symporter, GntP family [Arthrobacter cupressi]